MSVKHIVNFLCILSICQSILSKKVNSLINNFLRKKRPSWNRKFLFLLAIFLPSLFLSCYFWRFFLSLYSVFIFGGGDFCSCFLFNGLLYCFILYRFKH